MTTYGFTAVVTGLDVENFEQLTRLYTEEFVIVPADRDGLTTLAVEIDAASCEAALMALQQHILHVPDVEVVRIDEDLVNVSEIALRLGVSREAPRLWAGQSNDVGVPFPVHHTIVGSPAKPQRFWRWAEVFAWVATTGRVDVSDHAVPLDADLVTWFNAQLLHQACEEPSMAVLHVDEPAVVANRARYAAVKVTSPQTQFTEARSSSVKAKVYRGRNGGMLIVQEAARGTWQAGSR